MVCIYFVRYIYQLNTKACQTKIEDLNGKKIVIESLSNFKPIGDLVDIDVLFKNVSVKTWIIRDYTLVKIAK
ncbi:hypothetical protein [Acidianus sp. RZ1]|uniref:hypothetical protein n=1 Tax=Acidianus sp. RZ1 TaxID=1540082 RepID=UPI001492EADC|nr:hypothetical protein [Acidianus sp. RZ1]NON62984.1 hypothetical protein [Acidianus sp. RZ1]